MLLDLFHGCSLHLANRAVMALMTRSRAGPAHMSGAPMATHCSDIQTEDALGPTGACSLLAAAAKLLKPGTTAGSGDTTTALSGFKGMQEFVKQKLVRTGCMRAPA